MFMKKLLLIGLIFLTGCTNPISSSINKEGDKTRAEIQAEFDIAKQAIIDENKAIIDQLDSRLKYGMDAITSYVNYLSEMQTRYMF